MQVKYRFDKETLRKIGRGALIALAGTTGTVLLQYATNSNFGAYTPVVTAGISILVNIAREYVKGQPQQGD